MANVIEDTEGLAVLGIVAVVLYFAWKLFHGSSGVPGIPSAADVKKEWNSSWAVTGQALAPTDPGVLATQEQNYWNYMSTHAVPPQGDYSVPSWPSWGDMINSWLPWNWFSSSNSVQALDPSTVLYDAKHNLNINGTPALSQNWVDSQGNPIYPEGSFNPFPVPQLDLSGFSQPLPS